jgi:hypothetical protein
MTALEKAPHQLLRCGDLTQPDNHFVYNKVRFPPIRGSVKNRTVSPRHRLKNPFTMSKRGAIRASYHRPVAGKPLFFIPRVRSRGEVHTVLHGIAFKANGGAYRDRTDDLMLAKQPLSQLS